ncbi:MAG: hypothetical protein ABL958_02770 [Bdellovibrionia bacterium]
MNNRGFATIESVALIVVFTVLFTYALGMFSAIHTGILNSIAARTYAWETLAHRTNVNFFRDNSGRRSAREDTILVGYRVHSVISEDRPNTPDPQFWATERYIASKAPEDLINRNANSHASLNSLKKRDRLGVNPIWIKTAYGICLTSTCGGP